MKEHETPCQHALDTRENQDKLEVQLEKIWLAIDKINENYTNRLPVWGTTFISILTLLLGSFLTAFLGLLLSK